LGRFPTPAEASVSKDDVSTDDAKAKPALTTADGMKFRLTAGMKRGVRIPIWRGNLVFRFDLTSAAGGGINATIPVQPSLSSEYSALKSLYDEVKVTGGEVHYLVTTVGNSTAVGRFMGITYDPVDSGMYSSVAGTLEAQQHKLTSVSTATSSNLITPNSTVGSGLWHFSFRVPTGAPARSVSVGTTQFSGEWASTTDSSDTWGFVKPFVELGGAALLTTLSGYCIMHAEFRSRT
jgi:hypothetical protein